MKSDLAAEYQNTASISGQVIGFISEGKATLLSFCWEAEQSKAKIPI